MCQRKRGIEKGGVKTNELARIFFRQEGHKIVYFPQILVWYRNGKVERKTFSLLENNKSSLFRYFRFSVI